MADEEYTGFQEFDSGSGDLRAQQFQVEQILLRVRTAMVVEVVAVSGGGVAPPGTVDVRPLVAQVNGLGKTTPHGIINGLPYIRLQGGPNAVIIDPQVGDKGLAVFCDRDISAAIAARGAAAPGSRRRFSMSDGVYIGGFLNGTPTQYVRFSDGGIELVSPVKVKITAPAAELTVPETTVTGNITMTGNLSIAGNITDNGKNIGSTHTHTNTTPGTGTSGPPS